MYHRRATFTRSLTRQLPRSSEPLLPHPLLPTGERGLRTATAKTYAAPAATRWTWGRSGATAATICRGEPCSKPSCGEAGRAASAIPRQCAGSPTTPSRRRRACGPKSSHRRPFWTSRPRLGRARQRLQDQQRVCGSRDGLRARPRACCAEAAEISPASRRSRSAKPPFEATSAG